jgi:hypothetical protein
MDELCGLDFDWDTEAAGVDSSDDEQPPAQSAKLHSVLTFKRPDRERAPVVLTSTTLSHWCWGSSKKVNAQYLDEREERVVFMV